jgi:signal recognition particle subunit SRP68
LALIQHAIIQLREVRSVLSFSDSDPITSGRPSYYSLSSSDFDQLESDLAADGLNFKKAWFAYNGGSTDADNTSHTKPLFFNIALNYVRLDMERLQERAGKKPPTPSLPNSGQVKGATTVKAEPEKKPAPKAKVEEVREATPEGQPPTRGGLSSLLGGWWGKS